MATPRAAAVRVRIKGSDLYLAAPQGGAPPARMEATPAAPHHAASTGRRLGGWRPGGAGPNSVVAASAPLMVERSRDLGRNNPHSKRGVSLYKTHIVGTGIKPRSLCSDPAVRAALHTLWSDWTDEADANGALDFYGLQAQAVGEMVQGGEAFVRLRPRRAADGLTVPLQIQVIPPELVPLSYNLPNGGNGVTQGIERDALNRRVAYWMLRRHPGDAAAVPGESWQPVRVDTADVCHLRAAPADQLRGLPWLEATLTTLHQLGQWKDATLLRKQMLAALVGFVRRAVSTGMSEADLAAAWGRVQRELGELPAVTLEPGTMQYLEPGEEVSFTNWQETSGADEVFERAAVRNVAAGLDLIYEELSGDWNGVNDRVYRAAFNTFKRTIRQHQHHLVAFQLCRPIWRRWIDAAVMAGALRVPAGISDTDLKRVEWQPEDWEYLHPVQDIQAKRELMEAGLESRASIAARRGDDIEVIDEQRAADAERERRLTLTPAPSKRPPPTDDQETMP